MVLLYKPAINILWLTEGYFDHVAKNTMINYM